MVTRRSGKRSVPPSRRRYEASHPTLTVRVSRELYEELQELRNVAGLSYSDVLKQGLDEAKVATEDAYVKGYEEGSDSGEQIAKEKYEVTYYCSRCRRRHLTIDTDREKEAAAMLMYEARWHSPRCAQR